MDKEIRKANIEKAYELSREIVDLLQGIVWEPQEGQEDHFDELPKLEQIELVKCSVNSKQTASSLYFLLKLYEDLTV